MASETIEALLSLADEKNNNPSGTRKRKPSQKALNQEEESRSRRRVVKESQNVVVATVIDDQKVVVATIVEEPDKESDKEPNKAIDHNQSKWTTTKNLVISNFETIASRFLDKKPSILLRYHLDHINHLMMSFANKEEGFIILAEMVHFPKIGPQDAFMEYALLVKQKEDKWELLFKRCADDKIYWDVMCLRESCSRLDISPNTLGGSSNFDIFLADMHRDYLQKYFSTKPDGFKVLVRTILNLRSNKKIHCVMWKDGDKFYSQDEVVEFDNEEIFWDIVFTINMFVSRITRQ